MNCSALPLRPVKQLIHGMNSLAEGHFGERLDFGKATPMKDLADTFNTLASELQNIEMLRSDFVNNFSHEFRRLAYMATNVLNLTKIENQSILADTTEYNLSEQLRKCILLLEKKWMEKDIEFAADFGKHFIHADQELLKQVWVNLLDNAIKFSPPSCRSARSCRTPKGKAAI